MTAINMSMVAINIDMIATNSNTITINIKTIAINIILTTSHEEPHVEKKNQGEQRETGKANQLNRALARFDAPNPCGAPGGTQQYQYQHRPPLCQMVDSRTVLNLLGLTRLPERHSTWNRYSPPVATIHYPRCTTCFIKRNRVTERWLFLFIAATA